MKRCKHCGIVKPLGAFYGDRKAKDGHRPECKECNRASRRVWYQANRRRVIDRVIAWQRANRDRYNARQREYRKRNPDRDWPGYLRRKFGVTVAAYDRLVAEHESKCAICGIAPEGRTRHHLDHDPEAMTIRGLLCVRCNNGLGQFRDDTALLLRAADYVECGGLVPRETMLAAAAHERALALRQPVA